MPKILIVDDEPDIREILQFNLEHEGFEVDTAPSAEVALGMLGPSHQLILLDVMMGGMSGYKMAEKLRQAGNPVPIIFLTAKGTENDMLTGFSVGADDYIAKPFSIKEVVVRIRALLNRVAMQQPGSTVEKKESLLVLHQLSIDLATKEVKIADQTILLTRTELEILTLLASSPGRVFSRDELLQRVWRDTSYVAERTVDVHITRLRKKLGASAPHIINRTGYGYYIEN